MSEAPASEIWGPPQGVKVVSCSTAQAGTVPNMLMADLGADVIKIEGPEGGDSSRRMTVLPGMPGTIFETNNRGVKSVTLNLKAPEGRAILHKLVAHPLMPWAHSHLAMPGERAFNTRLTPSAASASAQARPSPRLEAQTMAVLPPISKSIAISLYKN